MKTTTKPTNDFSKSQYSSISRRSFLGKSLAVGAGTIGAGLLANAPTARASGGIKSGDAAPLRVAAAAGIIQTDLLGPKKQLRGGQNKGGPSGTRNPDYTHAIEVPDEKIPPTIQ